MRVLAAAGTTLAPRLGRTEMPRQLSRPQRIIQRNRWRKLYRHKVCVRDRQPKSDTHKYNRYVISNIDDACAGSTRGGCSEGHGPVDAGHGAFRSGPSTETRRRSSSDTSALIGAHSARWANGGLCCGASRGPGFCAIPCFQTGQPQPAAST